MERLRNEHKALTDKVAQLEVVIFAVDHFPSVSSPLELLDVGCCFAVLIPIVDSFPPHTSPAP
jgi:hypothetical protein